MRFSPNCPGFCCKLGLGGGASINWGTEQSGAPHPASIPSTGFALSRSPRPPKSGDSRAGKAPRAGFPEPGVRAARRRLDPSGPHLPEHQEPLAQQRQRYPQQAQSHQPPHGAGAGAARSGRRASTVGGIRAGLPPREAELRPVPRPRPVPGPGPPRLRPRHGPGSLSPQTGTVKVRIPLHPFPNKQPHKKFGQPAHCSHFPSLQRQSSLRLPVRNLQSFKDSFLYPNEYWVMPCKRFMLESLPLRTRCKWEERNILFLVISSFI